MGVTNWTGLEWTGILKFPNSSNYAHVSCKCAINLSPIKSQICLSTVVRNYLNIAFGFGHTGLQVIS